MLAVARAKQTAVVAGKGHLGNGNEGYGVRSFLRSPRLSRLIWRHLIDQNIPDQWNVCRIWHWHDWSGAPKKIFGPISPVWWVATYARQFALNIVLGPQRYVQASGTTKYHSTRLWFDWGFPTSLIAHQTFEGSQDLAGYIVLLDIRVLKIDFRMLFKITRALFASYVPDALIMQGLTHFFMSREKAQG